MSMMSDDDAAALAAEMMGEASDHADRVNQIMARYGMPMGDAAPSPGEEDEDQGGQ
jgi:hypothetical protein